MTRRFRLAILVVVVVFHYAGMVLDAITPRHPSPALFSLWNATRAATWACLTVLMVDSVIFIVGFIRDPDGSGDGTER